MPPTLVSATGRFVESLDALVYQWCCCIAARTSRKSKRALLDWFDSNCPSARAHAHQVFRGRVKWAKTLGWHFGQTADCQWQRGTKGKLKLTPASAILTANRFRYGSVLFGKLFGDRAIFPQALFERMSEVFGSLPRPRKNHLLKMIDDKILRRRRALPSFSIATQNVCP